MGRNNLVGAWGEALAAEYLRKKGYQILARSYRCRYGEIDLIARRKGILAFVEVKLRKNDSFAQAREYVSFTKQDRLRKTASMYLAEAASELQPRFDVVEIYAPQGVDTIKPTINHLEGAFE